MIEDMAARKLNPHTRRGHIHSCKRFAAWLKRSPDTATAGSFSRSLMCQTSAARSWRLDTLLQ